MVNSAVLVTGSSGFVGKRLVQKATEVGYHVEGVDRRPSTFTTVVANIDESLDLNRRFDAVVHCAAEVSVTKSMQEPREVLSNNSESTLSALEYARKNDSPLLFFSSAAVYGEPPVVPTSEAQSVSPRSPYGTSKVIGEELVEIYARSFGVNCVIIRPFNIYDSDLSDAGSYAGVVKHFYDRLLARRPLTVFGDGKQTRDFVHVRDVIAFVQQFLKQRVPPGTYNIGTGEEISINQVASIFSNAASPPLPIERAPPRLGEIGRSCADIARARSTGWSPKVSILAGLEELIQKR